MDRRRIPSLDEFDDHFGGMQSVFNWVQDLDIELHNAGIKDAQFFRERISLCETIISRFSSGKLPTDNFKTALAESHFELGNEGFPLDQFSDFAESLRVASPVSDLFNTKPTVGRNEPCHAAAAGNTRSVVAKPVPADRATQAEQEPMGGWNRDEPVLPKIPSREEERTRQYSTIAGGQMAA